MQSDNATEPYARRLQRQIGRREDAAHGQRRGVGRPREEQKLHDAEQPPRLVPPLVPRPDRGEEEKQRDLYGFSIYNGAIMMARACSRAASAMTRR